MKKEVELINISCPSCGNPIVSRYKDKAIYGLLQHKCSKCKRYWDVDYTNKKVIWVKGKENNTEIKEYILDLETGNCKYLLY